MKIAGEDFKVIDTFDSVITIPDCFVLGKNKLGTGHGEAKLYVSPKAAMHEFFGEEGFSVKCCILKSDLEGYLSALENEYAKPSQEYVGKKDFPKLWQERVKRIGGMDDIIYFTVTDQTQITGTRGYVNSKDMAYRLIREVSLPLVSYLSVMELEDKHGEQLFYWKLFVDFEAIAERKNGSAVFSYGKKDKSTKSSPKVKKDSEISKARIGQGKYRDSLLEECPFCPITMVNDERLLIASHIKPWASSTDKERTDPKNGYMLTPLYDKLFDRGFITFTEDKRMHVSNWLSPKNCQRLGLKDNSFYQHLPMDDARKAYLQYHREFIFKG